MIGNRVRGHLDMMILAVLSEADLHGYAISEELARRSGGELSFPEGTLYPALYRLEGAGLLSSRWSDDAARRRRVYAITAAGRKQLVAERTYWQRLVRAVAAVAGA